MFSVQSQLIKHIFNVAKIKLPWDYQQKLLQGCKLKQQ